MCKNFITYSSFYILYWIDVGTKSKYEPVVASVEPKPVKVKTNTSVPTVPPPPSPSMYKATSYPAQPGMLIKSQSQKNIR